MTGFERIESDAESAVDACTEAIRARILSGDLVAGARLPAERQLAEQLGVNRLTLRSALARLSAAHLLSVRHGSGYLVRPWRREGGPDLLAGIVALARDASEQEALVRDLLAVRRQLAGAVLERLATGVDSRARAAIATAVARFASLAASGADLAAIVEADLAVVAEITLATGSAVFALCTNPIARVLHETPGLAEAMFADPTSNARAYETLLAWLGAPSPESIPLVVDLLAQRDAATLARYRSTKRRRRRS
jgi:DNA-binding FadR family transcriptional regulator